MVNSVILYCIYFTSILKIYSQSGAWKGLMRVEILGIVTGPPATPRGDCNKYRYWSVMEALLLLFFIDSLLIAYVYLFGMEGLSKYDWIHEPSYQYRHLLHMAYFCISESISRAYMSNIIWKNVIICPKILNYVVMCGFSRKKICSGRCCMWSLFLRPYICECPYDM